MNITQKQVARATIEAEGVRRLYSELRTRFVCNGQGRMSQRYFQEEMKRRNGN